VSWTPRGVSNSEFSQIVQPFKDAATGVHRCCDWQLQVLRELENFVVQSCHLTELVRHVCSIR
jgi:hypothetical protein